MKAAFWRFLRDTGTLKYDSTVVKSGTQLGFFKTTQITFMHEVSGAMWMIFLKKPIPVHYHTKARDESHFILTFCFRWHVASLGAIQIPTSIYFLLLTKPNCLANQKTFVVQVGAIYMLVQGILWARARLYGDIVLEQWPFPSYVIVGSDGDGVNWRTRGNAFPSKACKGHVTQETV